MLSRKNDSLLFVSGLLLASFMTSSMVSGQDTDIDIDHRAPPQEISDSQPNSSRGGASAHANQNLPMTRQEALVQGLRKLFLNPAALKRMVETAQKNPKLDIEAFDKMVDNLAKDSKEILAMEQAEGLKDLIRKELGDIENSNLGKEFSVAAQQVLEKTDSPPGKPGDKQPKNPVTQDPNQKNNPVVGSSAPLDSTLLDKLLGQLGNKQGAEKKSAINDEIGKQLGKLQELMKNLGGAQQPAMAEGRAGGGGPGLLDALRSALDKGKDDKDKDGSDNALDDLSKSLKNAMPQHAPMPKGKDSGEEEPKKNDSNERKNDSKDKKEDSPSLSSMKSNKGSDDTNGKKKEEKKPLEGASSSKKDKNEEAAASREDKDNKSPFDNPFEQEPTTPDASQLAQALQKAKMNSMNSKKSPAPGIGDSGGSSPGEGGSSSDGGGLNDSGGGNGTMGPNIVGTGSAIPGGNFEGDPFSGVGKSSWGGRSQDSFALSKPTEAGSSGGDISPEEDDSGGISGGFVSTSETPEDQKKAFLPLVLKPSSDEEGEQPVLLMSYIGNWGKTICKGSESKKIGLCSKLSSRYSLARMRKYSSQPNLQY